MNKRYWIYSAISAAALLLGLHPCHLWWLSWFSLLPLFLIALDATQKSRSIAEYTLAVGTIAFGYGLYWITAYETLIFALVFLCFAPTFAIYFLLFRLLTRNSAHPSLVIVTAPLLWLALQKLYSFTPFGTIAAEIPFYGPFAFFQIASVFGFTVHGAMVIGLNASIAAYLKRRNASALLLSTLFVALLGTSYMFGAHRLKEPSPQKRELRVSLIQHNFPVDIVWNIQHRDLVQSTYRDLALKASKEHPDLIVFPLYNILEDVFRNPQMFTDLARETNAYILLATYIPHLSDPVRNREFYHMAILYSPFGKIEDYYQTVVPPPFRHVSEIVVKRYKVIDSPFGKLGINLCYENGLSRLSRRAVKLGARMLISLSNPGHFTHSHMPYYHLMQDRLRAIETGRPVVRVSANGYSALIDSKGRIVQQTTLNTADILQVITGGEEETTFYQSHADWVSMVSFLWVGIILWRKRY
ncbi:MAG: hypothetical protein A3J52_01180 [Omnitrophica bacterium RIFCSPHIGHO2_02_FULL_49_9]|nr:MAG: hypothetical protein A3J52_01180 [Omnitrophica bacterium RIFCSPHIGHO2_02_FULL_49_9]OGW90098.1 MAG: hypothetical protein A3A73_01000 [Omnitrophica bacterium RIFCSPLOWO2_01_FULL_50_24]